MRRYPIPLVLSPRAADITKDNKIRTATALLVEESMLWPAAKSHLSLCACIISYSRISGQGIGKVSLFSKRGEIFSCPCIPP